MKIYFNNLGIETSRVLDDVFVKNDVGRRIEAYFDGVDISSANISARLIIEWPNGDTTNALIMTKFIDASGFYIILPQLIQDGTATFTIRITNLLEDYLQNTPQFTREILESVDAADDTNITPAEYAAMQEAINENASNIIASLNAAKNYSDAQLNARLRVLNVDDISDENTILELYSDLASEHEETGEAIKFNFVGEDQGGYKYLGNVNADFGESGDPMWITFFKDGSIYYYYLHDTGEEIDVKAVQFEARNTTTTLTNEDKLITSAAVKAVTDLCARTTYVDALIQQIVDGTIIAKKAECDKVGDDITTKYAKVDGNNVYTGVQNFDDAIITIPIADQPTKPVRLSQLTDAIDKLEDGTTIANKAKKDRLGNVIDATYAHRIVIAANSSTYQYTFSLLDAQGNTLNSQVIDLPLESVVVGGEYDGANKAIILTLDNGQEIEIPVADLVEGLQTEITPSNKLASDLVDTTNQTHKFVTAEEKAQITANKNEIADVRVIAEEALDRTSVHDDEIMQLTIDLDNVEARLDLAKFNKSDVDTSMANPTSDAKVLSEKAVKNYVDDGLAPKANKDGNYPTMTVGAADNLTPYSEDSGAEQSKPFIAQGTGTDNNTAIVTTGALGLLKEKQGNSVVVNQQSQDINSSNWSTVDVSKGTASFNNGEMTYTIIQAGQSWNNGLGTTFKVGVAEHKYLVLFSAKASVDNLIIQPIICGVNETQKTLSTSYKLYSDIITAESNTYMYIPTRSLGNANDTFSIKDFVCIDLTQWFGSNDNIPADLLAHPENWYRYYQGSLAYNTGTLENANGVKLVCTQGRNLWDEEWEAGAFDTITGDNISSNGIRSKYLIRATPNTIYYAKCPSGSNVWAMYYDKDNNVIQLPAAPNYANNVMRLDLNTTRLSPANAVYMKYYVTDYGTTYNHDITISLYYTPEQGGEGYDKYYPYVASKLYDTGSEKLLAFDIKEPSGLIHRNTAKYTFTGNEDWNYYEAGTQSFFYVSISSLNCKPSGKVIVSNGIKVLVNTTTNIRAYLYENPQISSSTNMQTVFANGTKMEYELATPTTEQGTSFSENIEISDYGMMYWLDSNDNLVGIPQGAKFFYPVDYKGFIDDVYARTNGDAQDIVVQSDLAPLTSLQNAIGGTLRQCLCVKETLDFDNTDFVDLGELTWAGEQGRFVATLTGAKKTPDWTTQAKILCSKYKAATANDVYNQLVDKAISLTPQDNVSIYLRDTTYADATTFKAVMKGVLLAYEKASE